MMVRKEGQKREREREREREIYVTTRLSMKEVEAYRLLEKRRMKMNAVSRNCK